MKSFFADKRYPGRFIVVGKDGGAFVAIYGATGRSPSSLKREFVELGDGVYMTATDATVAIEGNPDLLEYPAVRLFDTGIVTANGNQIERIEALELGGASADEFLAQSLEGETYEPDEHRTPRITGCIVWDGAPQAALHIARSAAGDADRSSWRVPLTEGAGSYIATYTGSDVKPTPSFASDPLTVPLAFGSAEAAARGFFDALAPSQGEPDYRVGVVAVYAIPGEFPSVAIINRSSS